MNDQWSNLRSQVIKKSKELRLRQLQRVSDLMTCMISENIEEIMNIKEGETK